jgi:hypothetical protein
MVKWWPITLIPLLYLSISQTVLALDVTLRWDPVVTDIIAGYKLYYKRGVGGAPYDGTISNQGPSPVDIPVEALADPNNPEFSITGLADDIYYFVATAYDTQGRESEYSNEAATTAPTPPPDPGPPPAPTLRIDSITYGLDYTVQGLPVNLVDIIGSATITIDITNRPATGQLKLILSVFDPDFIDEGRLELNGTRISTLFSGGNAAFDAQVVNIEIVTDVSLWNDGVNTLTFWHDLTQGYEIRDIRITGG